MSDEKSGKIDCVMVQDHPTTSYCVNYSNYTCASVSYQVLKGKYHFSHDLMYYFILLVKLHAEYIQSKLFPFRSHLTIKTFLYFDNFT